MDGMYQLNFLKIFQDLPCEKWFQRISKSAKIVTDGSTPLKSMQGDRDTYL